MALVLIGMMGSGKSVVGRRAAFRLSWEFVDLDRVIRKNAAMDIELIFKIEGEDGFRQRERDALDGILPAADRILAAGGGTPTFEENWPRLRSHGTVVHLAVDAETALARIGEGRGRPMLGANPRESLEGLMRERADWYARADETVDTNGRTVDEVVEIVAALARSRA